MARRKREPNRLLVLILAALVAANSIIIVSRLGRGAPLPGAGVELPEYVTKDYIVKNPYSRPGTPLTEINAVVIHYVGNPDSSAIANRNYFNNLALTHETYASSHFVVGLEGEVIACVPLTEVAYASNDRNGDTVSIEVCHPDAGGEYAPETYERVVELAAWLCETFDLKAEEDIIRHYDVTGKICPKFYVEHPEAWERLKADIAEAMP
ncbi:MAG: N-acetylmuramoyl-L-alanine amidase [Oscillibacter sp.]|nr:N-acetylmuramoyl-L-alanine amidase [Oscillibacter sp.]